MIAKAVLCMLTVRSIDYPTMRTPDAHNADAVGVGVWACAPSP